mmetsp:Transcript_9555/g.58210  ORF Transcript_9555/g.58210 Transcript_9555/m.58210 type:complete len:99 (-) Transcript_9555:1604-1900(-)
MSFAPTTKKLPIAAAMLYFTEFHLSCLELSACRGVLGDFHISGSGILVATFIRGWRGSEEMPSSIITSSMLILLVISMQIEVLLDHDPTEKAHIATMV